MSGEPDGGDLSRAYRASRHEVPPAALDAAIRAAAHDAAGRGRGRFAGWRRAVPVAAVVVLSVALVQLVPRERPPATIAPPGDAPGGVSSEAPPPASVPSGAERAAEEVRALPAESRALRKLESPAAVSAPRPSSEPDEAGLFSGAPAVLDATEGDARGQASPARDDAERESLAQPAEAPHRASVEAWVEHIEQLLAVGRREEAEAEFAAFRRAHPQHPFVLPR